MSSVKSFISKTEGGELLIILITHCKVNNTFTKSITNLSRNTEGGDEKFLNL